MTGEVDIYTTEVSAFFFFGDGGGGGVTFMYMVFNSLSLHKSRKSNLNMKWNLFILSEVERIPFQKEEEEEVKEHFGIVS